MSAKTEAAQPVENGATETTKPAKKEKSKKRSRDDSGEGSAEKDKKEKRHKKDKASTTTEANDNGTTNGASEKPANFFFVDTVGGGGEETPADNLNKGKAKKQKELHPSKKRIFEVSSVKREDYAASRPPAPVKSGNAGMHPDRAAMAYGIAPDPEKTNEEKAPKPNPKYKQAQTAYFPDTSLSISEMVKRHTDEMKKPGPDGKIPKRRAPRNIRKDARAAKQAALDAEAAAQGKIAAPVSQPMTKSERRHLRKNPKPLTERRKVKIERKLRKQERAKEGARERKEIENEALRMVEEMEAKGIKPDISKPLEEILAETKAKLAHERAEEKVKASAQLAVEKIKAKGMMPLDKTEAEVFAEQEQKVRAWNEGLAKAKAEHTSWPPPKPKKDFSHVEMPELEVPKFRTVTMGIPIPNSKKRGSLKQLRAALVSAGLTEEQQAAYIAKALEDKKEQRRVKDEIRTQKRIARKAARARKKLKIQQGLAERKKTKEEKAKEKAKTDPKLAAKHKKKAKQAETLSHNTTIMLDKRERDIRERGEEYTAPNKTEIKQARRAARKVVRLAKKGRLSRDEVPDRFKLKRSQKLKLTGNGGRIPQWTAMEIAENVRTAQEDAIKAAEKSNKASHEVDADNKSNLKAEKKKKSSSKDGKEKKNKKSGKSKSDKENGDDFVNGDGYIAL